MLRATHPTKKAIMTFPARKQAPAFLTLIIAAASVPTAASAITVEIARKCDAALSKAFPPRVPGNPAAGSAAGSGAAQRVYYSKCVADAEAEASKGAGTTDGTRKPPAPAK